MEAKELLAYYHEVDEKYERYKKILNDNREILLDTQSAKEKVERIKNLYTFMKEICPEFYLETIKEFTNFDLLSYLLLDCEDTLEKEYILDTTSNFHVLKKPNLVEEELITSTIVYWTRKALLKKLGRNGKYRHTFDFYDVSNYCEFASEKTVGICNKMSIPCYQIKIEPGFIKNSMLCNGSGYHYFNIILIQDIPYLVDCTYKQFFLLKKCFLERIGIPYLYGCYAGAFMMMKEGRRKLAEKLIRDGYILLTDEVLKDYLDGFALSYRNGLYYERTSDFSYTTSYTSEDYKNFLKWKDSQLHHEGDIVLGLQRKPLKNPYMSFAKR